MWELLQDAKDKGLAQASSSGLFILHFSDPRSHWVYRKSQYYQGGMRCCLMSLLLHLLNDMLQNPQLLSHIHLWPKPEAKFGHTDSFYPAPPSLDVIATTTNPRQFGLTDTDLGLTEMAMQTLYCLLQLVWSHQDMKSITPCFLDQFSVCLLLESVSPSSCNWSHRDDIFP